MTDALLLREQDRREIVRLLARHLPDVTAWAYGSRVNGGAHEGSDLDIVLRSPDLSPIPLEELRAFVQALRDSNIPILVEARDWARLPESFQQEIMKNYVVLRETVSEWMDVKLNDIIEIIGGGTPKTSIHEYWNGEIPWLSVADFNTGRKFVSTAEKYITEDGLNNSSSKLLHAGDIIISARGTVGVVAVLEKNMAFNQSCYGIKGIKGLSETDYIYYLLRDTVENFLQIAHGGVFDTITRETFKEILCFLPPLHEQKAIASVLSSLDDKIDLLHRQNKTLESMAEALFRQWFVEEAGEDWEEIAIGELFSISSGKAAKKITDSECYPVYGANGIIGYTHSFLYEEKILLTGRVGTLGNVFRVENERIWPSDNTLVVIPEKYYNFVYFSLKNAKLEEYDVGSTQPLVRQSDIKNIKILIPYDEKLNLFERETENIFQKKNCNNSQIRTLEKLRDTLLPKLMSGEVRVAC